MNITKFTLNPKNRYEDLFTINGKSIKILEGAPFTQDSWNLFCGELFDTIKDKVVEKQAYLVKNFNLEIEDISSDSEEAIEEIAEAGQDLHGKSQSALCSFIE